MHMDIQKELISRFHGVPRCLRLLINHFAILEINPVKNQIHPIQIIHLKRGSRHFYHI